MSFDRNSCESSSAAAQRLALSDFSSGGPASGTAGSTSLRLLLGAIVGALLLVLSGGGEVRAGCGDYLLQYGRFRNQPLHGMTHGAVHDRTHSTGNGLSSEAGLPVAPTSPFHCEGPTCSQRGLPTPDPVRIVVSPSREVTVALQHADWTAVEWSYFDRPEMLAVARRHVQDVFRPPR